MSPPDVRLRPATGADVDFLRSVYASTRAEELDLTGWSPEQRAVFVSMQFDAQRADYARRHPDGRLDVVVVDGNDAGRLWVDRTPEAILVMDIALLPAWRGRGVASRLLSDLVAEAATRSQVVVLHVEKFNRARRLYERLGFEVVEDGPLYVRLENSRGRDDRNTPAAMPPRIPERG
ncbi:MAG TPA: GNAT family N-acetyltransferase [Candidatus Dormibacteraeota bacterium]|nr:GNAT family N-acetyltransferase [Candidatus Dormibacteraeota bacterium]